MATWPSTSPSTTTTDADSDSISGARADINQAITNINAVVDMFDMSTLADDRILVYDAASATFKVEDNVSGFTGDMNGNVLYDSTQDLIIEDDLVVRPNNTDDRQAFIGDFNITVGASTYDYTAIVADGAGEGWPLFVMKDYSTQTTNPNITNPAFLAQVFDGTPASPAALSSNRRLISFQAVPCINTSGDLAANGATFRVMAVTTETQSSTAQGNKCTFQTTKNGQTSPLNTLLLEGDKVTVNAAGGGGIGGSGGAGTIDCGGNLTIQANGGAGTVTIDSVVTVDGLDSPGDLPIQANGGTDDVIITRPRVNVYSTSATGGTYTPDYNDGEWQIWEATGGSAFNFNLPSNLASGQEMRITVYNNSGGNFNLTVDSSYLESFSVLTISDTFRSAILIQNHGGLYYASTIIHNQ